MKAVAVGIGLLFIVCLLLFSPLYSPAPVTDTQAATDAKAPDPPKTGGSIPFKRTPPAPIPLKASDERYDNWIVCTSVNPPTDSVEKMASLEGWHVVVVGDTKTPKDWHYPGVTFLSYETQLQLGYSSVHYVPTKMYQRKNVGYIYAIHHGAKMIYDTDDDNKLIVDTVPFLKDEPVAMLTYDSAKHYANPYIYFGLRELWPRGLPLAGVAPEHDGCDILKPTCIRPLLQQGLANGDPDVDAIWRLTRRDSTKPRIHLEFEDRDPVGVPWKTLIPTNSQNTVFHYDALWATALPTSPTFRVCDIWRGYFVGRLMWEIGGHTSFHFASVYQARNVHDYLLDFIDEQDVYYLSGTYVDVLREWKPDPAHTLFVDVALELLYVLKAAGIFKQNDVAFYTAWFDDLTAVGYNFPKLNRNPPQCEIPSSFKSYNTCEPTPVERRRR